MLFKPNSHGDPFWCDKLIEVILMDIYQQDLIKAGLFFLFIFISGIWLRASGKPYSTVKLNLHKFISLGTLIFLGMTVYRFQQAVGLSGIELTASIAVGILFVGTIVTGGLVSVEKEMPAVVKVFHKAGPYLTVLVTGLALYLMVW
jgi:hypothetical protein